MSRPASSRAPAWVGGIGERLDPRRGLPRAGIVLANPRRRAADRRGVPRPARRRSGEVGQFRAARRATPRRCSRCCAGCRNDLTEAAIGLVPEIAAVLARLARLPGALLARMSGSGATCFALFADRAAAERAARRLAAAEPGWWCAAGGSVAGARFTRF